MEYPHVFKFSDYTTDPRLLRFDPILQEAYQRILRAASAPAGQRASDYGDIVVRQTLTSFKTLLATIPAAASLTEREKNWAYYLFMWQYGKPVDAWPPADYPDVPVDAEDTAEMPPFYRVPRRYVESNIDSVPRIIRAMIDRSANPRVRGVRIQAVYEYLAAAKRVLIDGTAYPEISADIEAMRVAAPAGTEPSHLLFKLMMGDPAFEPSVATFGGWYKTSELRGLKFLNNAETQVDRYVGLIKPTWLEYITNLVSQSFYTDSVGNPLVGVITGDDTRRVQNRNQQVFVVIPPEQKIDGIRLFPHDTPLADTAWIKFDYPFPLPSGASPDPSYLVNCVKFQGYRLLQLPPAPILKALSHGPPVEMSDHVRTLFPEWTRPDTLKAWLKTVLTKWYVDIRALNEELLRDVCTETNTINESVRHLRDIPAIQLDLFRDAMQYILPRLQSGGGLSREITVSDREMVHRRQRGGATGMPLAYFNDGAQMRGTYAEATGVGLAGATNTMARSALGQMGGRRSRSRRHTRRRQQGGFTPSIMGPLVQNGAYLMPVASYMGYKLMKRGKGQGRRTRRR